MFGTGNFSPKNYVNNLNIIKQACITAADAIADMAAANDALEKEGRTFAADEESLDAAIAAADAIADDAAISTDDALSAATLAYNNIKLIIATAKDEETKEDETKAEAVLAEQALDKLEHEREWFDPLDNCLF